MKDVHVSIHNDCAITHAMSNMHCVVLSELPIYLTHKSLINPDTDPFLWVTFTLLLEGVAIPGTMTGSEIGTGLDWDWDCDWDRDWDSNWGLDWECDWDQNCNCNSG